MKTHYTIPIFLPFQGCPHKCIFCDQQKITGHKTISKDDIINTIEKHLLTILPTSSHIEVGFFGGTFTGIPLVLQSEYLQCVQSYLKKKTIHGIRLSTRPDFIDNEILNNLKKNNVTHVELGVQSMSDKVLLASKRGHTAKDTEQASKAILKKGFVLVHQIMLGLPLSDLEDELYTARRAKELGAKEARLYPVIVIKNTGLAELWKKKQYTALTEQEAVRRCADLIAYFNSNNINVIRCGLHPSEGLLNGSDYLAGPFHTAFRQKAENHIKTLSFLNNLFNCG